MQLASGLPHDALTITTANVHAISIRTIHHGDRYSAECRRLGFLDDICRVLLSLYETGRSPAGADPVGAPLTRAPGRSMALPDGRSYSIAIPRSSGSSKLVPSCVVRLYWPG